RRSGREWPRVLSRAHRTERSRHRGDHPSRTPFRRISRTQLERNHSEATAGGLVLFTPVYRHGCCAQGSSPNLDRKSTRLNSSHVSISYAVFCLKKKNK